MTNSHNSQLQVWLFFSVCPSQTTYCKMLKNKQNSWNQGTALKWASQKQQNKICWVCGFQVSSYVNKTNIILQLKRVRTEEIIKTLSALAALIVAALFSGTRNNSERREQEIYAAKCFSQHTWYEVMSWYYDRLCGSCMRLRDDEIDINKKKRSGRRERSNVVFFYLDENKKKFHWVAA